MQLLEQVDEVIRARRLIPRRGRVVVAVSGGLDSMVLLHVLGSLATRHDWRLRVAHLNHQLRGRMSRADESFVRQAAKKASLPFVSATAKVRDLASKEGLSLEMAARRLRHEFLARTARRFKATRVALAHHAQDQVELFFLRILRGAGVGGLSGMEWSNPSPADPAVGLIRPLLHSPRSTLLEYANRHTIRFREDASNQSTDILRNRVRHTLIPLLRDQFQPALTAVVLRQMSILSEEGTFVAEALNAWRQRSQLPAYNDWPVALQRRHIQEQLQALGVPGDFGLIETLREVSDRRIMVAPECTLHRDAEGRLHARQPGDATFQREALEVSLRAASGTASFQGWTLDWKRDKATSTKLPAKRSGCEWFDAGKVGKTIVLRHWRRGDRFQPIGMTRPVKLQDLFTNLKVPAAERRRRMLACTPEGDIWWVQGLRIGEAFKLRPATRHRLRWRWQPA